MSDTTMILVRWLLQLLPWDELYIDGEPYMRRYYLAGFAPRRACARCEATGWIDDSIDIPPGGSIECHVCDGVGYIKRSWWWRWNIGAARIHEIVSSDDARAFHDHPWDFVSIGLSGSYIEEQPAAPTGVHAEEDGRLTTLWPSPGDVGNLRRRYTAPWILRRRAEDLHTLALEVGPVTTGRMRGAYAERTVWTLVLMGRKRRSWGFAGPFGWFGFREFDEQHPDRNATPDRPVVG